MTDEQALLLQNAIREAITKILEPSGGVAYVLVAQDQRSGALEILTNAKRIDLVPELLDEAAAETRRPGRRFNLS